MSVSELSRRIVAALESMPSTVRVRGELSNLSTRQHWYFSLKDEDALVSCVMWASRNRGVDFSPSEGDEVEVSGHVGHYAPQGRTQLIVERMRPAGEGMLRARFEALCRELREAGWFDEERKQPLPMLPRCIAVVTSASSAAVRDVIQTARDRCPSTTLLVVDVRVQGDGAADEVAEAVRRLDAAADHLGIDAIVVTRGGGSLEDLQAFNERIVAEAVYECRRPLVAAIGHESDTTIIELVADRRASTPTQAMMHLLPDAQELQQQLQDRTSRLRLLARHRVEHAQSRMREQATCLDQSVRLALQQRHTTVHHLATRLASSRPDVQLQQRRTALQRIRSSLDAAISTHVHRHRGELVRREEASLRSIRSALIQQREHIDADARTLEALGPVSVLQRGFSMTMTDEGTVVRSAHQVPVGSTLVTHLGAGRLGSRVETVDMDDGEADPASGTVET